MPVTASRTRFKPILTGTFKPITATIVKPLQEKECYNYVQGRIAWDAAGKSKQWGADNVKKLCKGTSSKYAPGNCFNYAMRSGASWGRKPHHKMDWRKASKLCAGTNNANQVTTCFKKRNQKRQAIGCCH